MTAVSLFWYSLHWPLLLLAMAVLSACGAVLIVLIGRITVATGKARLYWRSIAALTVGIGLWSGCYISLLAVRLPVPFALDAGKQLAVLALATLVSLITVLAIDSTRSQSWLRLAIGAAAGLAASAMQLLSLTSLQMEAVLQLRPLQHSLWFSGMTLAMGGLMWLASFSALTQGTTARLWRVAFPALLGPVAVALHHGSIALTVLVPAAGRSVAGETAYAYQTAVPLAVATVMVLAVVAITVSSERRVTEFLTGLSERADDAFFTLSRTGRLLYINPVGERLVGGERTSLLGTKAWETLPESLVAMLREPIARAAASDLTFSTEACDSLSGTWYEVHVQPWPDLLTVSLRDVSIRKALEEQVRKQALRDPLTGLANRTFLRDRIEQALLAPAPRAFAVLFLDLDDFKLINDRYGHSAGDAVLVALAERLRAAVHADDTVSRLGGDEFAILLTAVTQTEAVTAAQRVTAAFHEPVLAGGRHMQVLPSIGIAMATDATESADELLRQADMAMYSAKAHGKGHVRVYDPSQYQAVLGRLALAQDLRRALETGGLVLHYQPVVALETGRILYLEALVRWQHPERGLLFPGDFVSLAEETGLIRPLGQWVLRAACQQARVWRDRFPDAADIRVGVNLSAAELDHPELVGSVAGALAETGLSPECLVLEVTESGLLKTSGPLLQRLGLLRQLGLSLAVDDFGTGYSALAYLRHFPFNIVKLDKSFVDGGGARERDRALLQGILNLARSLDLDVIAEGVERPDQAAMLKVLGCPFAQGYGFARPMPAEAVEAVLLQSVNGRNSSGVERIPSHLTCQEGDAR